MNANSHPHNLYTPPIRILVTVTYGQRWDLLRQALASAKSAGIDRAVVVDNGASIDIAQHARETFGEFVDVLRMGRNTGSAGGFKAGIRRALDSGADFILLLDDDNQIQAGCIAALSDAHQIYAQTVPVQSLAVLAYRSDRQAKVAVGMPASGMGKNTAAFLGFNVKDIPFKLFSRTAFGRRWMARRKVAAQIEVAFAPYSGMYFHRSVPEAHGLPDDRFVLYADDTDFSFRLTRAGGKIVLVTDAQLVDLERSWGLQTRFSNTFDALLLGEGDFRAFYSTRNNAYFEKWSRGDGIVRALNRAIYLLLLRTRAASIGRQQRLQLLLQAIRDGEMGRLGEHPDFPL